MNLSMLFSTPSYTLANRVPGNIKPIACFCWVGIGERKRQLTDNEYENPPAEPPLPERLFSNSPSRLQISPALLSNELLSKMYSFTAIFVYALTAELCRRCCLILIAAFTGPLSRIPGPVIGKFTLWAWIIQVIKGNQMNIAPGLFQQYGPVVRVGEDMT